MHLTGIAILEIGRPVLGGLNQDVRREVSEGRLRTNPTSAFNGRLLIVPTSSESATMIVGHGVSAWPARGSPRRSANHPESA